MKRKIGLSALFCSLLALSSGSAMILNGLSNSKSVEVKADASYNLWIAGIQVTDSNKDSILPVTGGQGLVAFDPDTHTLTLNNFTISPQDGGSTDPFNDGDCALKDIGIATTMDELKIDIRNNVTIGKEITYHSGVTTVDDYDFKFGIVSTKDITINGAGKFHVYAGKYCAVADNFAVEMDSNDSEVTLEALCPSSGSYDSFDATLFVNKNITFDSCYSSITSFEADAIYSDSGNVSVTGSQLEIQAACDGMFIYTGRLFISNSAIGFTCDKIGVEVPNDEDESGNICITNHSFIYDVVGENTAATFSTNGKIIVEDSRIFAFGEDAMNYYATFLCIDFELKGEDSLIFTNVGQALIMYEGPAKVKISEGTIITSALYGIAAGGENESDFIIGSEETPFNIKNGGLIDEDFETIHPFTQANGNVPMLFIDNMYMTYLLVLDPTANDGYMEVNTYATVTMEDYEFGKTVSTPSIDHNLGTIWGTEIEMVTYLYYAEGETIEDAKVWEDIEPDTLEIGTYYMVANILDTAFPFFSYYSDPVEFEVTAQSKTLIDKPTEDTTVYYFNGSEQTYNIPQNDAYTISNNVHSDAGTYLVKVSLKDKDNYSWDDGTTDDVTFTFQILRLFVAKPVADTTTFTYNGENQTYNVMENDAYEVTGNVAKEAGTHTVTVSLKDKNNSCWADGTNEDITFTFVIEEGEKACFTHWILIGLLVVGLALSVLFYFFIKKTSLGIISSSAFLLGSGVAAIFAGCGVCVVFIIINVILSLTALTAFIVRFIRNDKKETEEKNK